MDVIHESPPHKTTYVTISRDEYESMKATIEAIEDPEVMEQLRKSAQDIKEGETISLDEWKKKNDL
jgi:PHD/YefM family antitoxin component YafN of YafNO toxin-antitoxin module